MKRVAYLALTLLKEFPPLADCGQGFESVVRVVLWLQKCRAAWVQHPQFAYLQTLPDTRWMPFNAVLNSIARLFGHALLTRGGCRLD